MRKILLVVLLSIMLACSRANTPESAYAMALESYQKHSKHTPEEVSTRVTHEVEPKSSCVVSSCKGYAPIDCAVEAPAFGPPSIVARNLKDCYRVNIQEETAYKDGCSETTHSAYDVTIGRGDVISLGHASDRVMCGGGRFTEKAWKVIRSGDPYAAKAYLAQVTPRVFGKDERVFWQNIDVSSLSKPGKDGVILYQFCRAHFCTVYESVLAIGDDGRAAGVLVDNGKVYPYAGDYGSEASLPESLRDWLKQNTQEQGPGAQ